MKTARAKRTSRATKHPRAVRAFHHHDESAERSARRSGGSPAAVLKQTAASPPPPKKLARLAGKAGELARLRARLTEAEETIRAIRSGEVDVVVVTAKKGVQLFSLEGAEQAYRMLIESMNEGALTLTADKTILYANQCFARMVKCPLEQVTGGSFRRFLSAADRAALRPLMKQSAHNGSKMQVLLQAGDGSLLPVQISVREMARDSSNRLTIGMVVTDMTAARRTEELLRALTQRVVQVQEAERGRVALELHDNITQQLCAILFCSQALVDSLAAHDGPAKTEAIKLRDMLGQTAGEVERISNKLRSSVLEHLGLGAALRDTCAEFAKRTGVSITVVGELLTTRLPAGLELSLYRILQEVLKNVEQHAHARQVTLALTQEGAFVQLVIKDDGIGFNPDLKAARLNGKGSLDLLGMRERAIYAGGTLRIKSAPRAGTEIEVRIPLPPLAVAAA